MIRDWFCSIKPLSEIKGTHVREKEDIGSSVGLLVSAEAVLTLGVGALLVPSWVATAALVGVDAKRSGPIQPVTPRADTLETATGVLASSGWGTKTLEHKTNAFRL